MQDSRFVTRREVLIGAAAVVALGRVGLAQSGAVHADGFVSGAITPFAMKQVRLLAGDVNAAAEINQRYLDSLATDRLLHSFRLTAGITSTAAPCGGSEKQHLPTAA